MSARSQRSLQERDARSRLVKRIAELPMVNGNLRREARRCGTPSCHCQQGQKHVSESIRKLSSVFQRLSGSGGVSKCRTADGGTLAQRDTDVADLDHGLARIGWTIEACFRVAKEELGMDHFEVRGWRCIHRHYYVTALSYLLCSRIRQSLDQDDTGALTIERVRRSLNAYLAYHHLPPELRDEAFEKELADQHYYQT